MKLLYSHPNFAQVGLVRSLLESKGIACMMRNQHLSSLVGELPALEVWPQLWVADEDWVSAQQLVSSFTSATTAEPEPWICLRCGASNEGNMGLCWNCDWEVDAPEQQIAS